MDSSIVVQALEKGETRPSVEHKRAYKACLQCRKSKTKCELGANPRVCLKCAREQRDCVFPDQRSVRRKRAQSSSATSSNSNSRPPTAAARTIDTVDLIGVNHNATERGDLSSSYRRRSSANTSDIRPGEPIRATGLGDDVMQTVVSSSNDARKLLFAAAEQADTDESEDPPAGTMGFDGPSPASALTSNTKIFLPVVTLSPVSKEDMELWKQHRFVRQAWFTAQEAVTYIDLFFQNLSFLSPILDSSFADHRNHKHLILEEPLLCCTLLMISSRYHILPGYGSPSRAEFIHMRLWKYCEHLIYRITFGAEKYSTARTRTFGSIQALLLITEWHPRAIRFPPENDGWDPSLAPGIDDSYGHAHGKEDPNSIRWREEVFEPAKRSDRMSWTMIGLATTLAHELGVFEDTGEESEPTAPMQLTRLRIRKLLYLYVHQLTLRIGCTSIFPQACRLPTFQPIIPSTLEGQRNFERELLLSQYISITKLLKTANDMFFPSKSMTRQIIRSGNYLTLLEHFLPLLKQWHTDFLAIDLSSMAEASKQLLLVEYHYATVYINSVGIQAFVERAANTGSRGLLMDANGIHNDHPQDLAFNNAVREASCKIISIAIKLGEDGYLRHAPVRLFVRVVAASVFLLKSLSLGARNNHLMQSLEVLDRCNLMLKENQHDDVHLSARYGTLIGRLVRRFKKTLRFRSGPGASKAVSPVPEGSHLQRQSMMLDPNENLRPEIMGNAGFEQSDLTEFLFDANYSADDWFAQPFDASLAPFGTETSLGMSSLVPESLDFFWNLPLP